MPRSLITLTFLVLSLLAGCVPLSGGRVVYVGSTGYLTAVVVDAVTDPYPFCKQCGDTNVPVYPAGPADYGAAPLPASPRDRVPSAPTARAFDPVRARTALAETDLSTCRAVGAPRGYGHAIVTYSEEGAATKVVIDDPGGLSASAVQCVGLELGKQRVGSFDGPATEVGVTWFIQ